VNFCLLNSSVKQAVQPVVWPPQYAPASGDMNSHPELLAWRSLRMSVIQDIKFYPCTKF